MSVVVITGCSGGIGFEAALAFARNGDTVHATMRDVRRGTKLRSTADAERLNIRVAALDLTRADDFPETIGRIIDASGRIDVLVHNAGINHVGALAPSFAICVILAAIAGLIGQTHYTILFVTIITIVIANLFPKAMAALEGEFELGMIFMYIFFAMVGSGTNATAFIGSAMNLFLYGMLIIVFHLAILLVVARLLKVDLAEAIVASAAALVGPAPTAAIAISQGWRTLVTPGIMCGIFGYVIGTSVGVLVTAFPNGQRLPRRGSSFIVFDVVLNSAQKISQFVDFLVGKSAQCPLLVSLRRWIYFLECFFTGRSETDINHAGIRG